MEDDDVERAILERQRAAVALDEGEPRHVARELARLRDEDRGGIDADHPADTGPGGERARDRSRTAADLDDLRVRREVDVREVRLAHRAQLRIRSAKLEDLDQALDNRWLDLGNRGVDVGHSNPPARACSALECRCDALELSRLRRPGDGGRPTSPTTAPAAARTRRRSRPALRSRGRCRCRSSPRRGSPRSPRTGRRTRGR
jgi:hypothetical protein